MKIVSAFLVVLLTASTANCQYLDEEKKGIQTVEGTVSSVDVMASKITISGVQEMTLSVPVSAKISKDIYDIKLSDIKAGDYVTIEYYARQSGKPEAQKITVEYREGEGSW